MDFLSNMALDIYLSVGTLFKYILTTFFGMTKIKNNNNNNRNSNKSNNKNSLKNNSN